MAGEGSDGDDGQQAILHPQDRAKGGESLLRPPAPVRPLPVVILTTFFPNRREPHRTVFLRNLVTAMRPGCDIAVVAPIPRRPPIGRWRERAAFPSTDRLGDLALHHPRFLSLPGLSWLAGLSYAWGVWPVLRDLKQARGWFVVHIHCAYPDAVGGALAARLLGLPWVVTVHGSDINIAARKPALRPQIRWALRGAQRVVAVSRALQEVSRAGRPATRAGRVHTLLGLRPRRVQATIPGSVARRPRAGPRCADGRVRGQLAACGMRRVAPGVGSVEGEPLKRDPRRAGPAGADRQRRAARSPGAVGGVAGHRIGGRVPRGGDAAGRLRLDRRSRSAVPAQPLRGLSQRRRRVTR